MANASHEPRSLLTLSLATPAYNEAGGIETIVTDWLDYLKRCPYLRDFEIVVCNDGSRDETGPILDRLAAADHRLQPVHFATNQGAAAALTNAIRYTTMDWVLLIDSDGQFPIENLPRLVAALDAGDTRAVMGVREKKDAAFARFGSWSSGVLCNLFHGTRLRDFNSAFKLVEGTLLRSLVLEAKGLNYSTEITSRLLERRVKLVEVEIVHRPRTSGKSSRTLFRSVVHRFLFVLYVGMRQLLLKLNVIQRTT